MKIADAGFICGECGRMFDTNLFGAIECMQAVTPVMQALAGAIQMIPGPLLTVGVAFGAARSRDRG